MNAVFRYCRVCLKKDENYSFPSIFDDNGYMRKLFFEKFHLSYHQYIFDRYKVLICGSCAKEVEKAKDFDEIAYLKSSINYFNLKFFNKLECQLFSSKLILNEPLPPDFPFVYRSREVLEIKGPSKTQPSERLSRLRARRIVPIKMKRITRRSFVATRKKIANKQIKPKRSIKPRGRKNDKVQKENSSATCGICGKTFYEKRNRVNHENNVHHKLKPNVNVKVKRERKENSSATCEICGKTFYNMTNRKRHEIEVHHKLKSNVNVKVKKERKENSTPWCEKCGKSFCGMRSLGRHINEIHLQLKPYGCRFCQMKFARNSILTHHLRNCKPIYRLRRRSTIPKSYRLRFIL